MADAKGITLAQLALAWTQQPGVTSPIIEPRTMEHLEDNLGALDVTFTADELAIPTKSCRPAAWFPVLRSDFGPRQFRW
ncbi:MAG: aldo/keto reductase [Caldilineaceae bacterium]